MSTIDALPGWIALSIPPADASADVQLTVVRTLAADSA
jgi:hypothetical protein